MPGVPRPLQAVLTVLMSDDTINNVAMNLTLKKRQNFQIEPFQVRVIMDLCCLTPQTRPRLGRSQGILTFICGAINFVASEICTEGGDCRKTKLIEPEFF